MNLKCQKFEYNFIFNIFDIYLNIDLILTVLLRYFLNLLEMTMK